MRLWRWIKTNQDHSGAAKFAYDDLRQLLLYQNWSSPWAAPIVPHLAPLGNINLFEGGQITVQPVVGLSGYGGVVPGQVVLQPLQSMSASSGGL